MSAAHDELGEHLYGALEGVDLTAYDRERMSDLVEQCDPAVVVTVIAWLQQVRALGAVAGHQEAAARGRHTGLPAPIRMRRYVEQMRQTARHRREESG